MCRKGRRRTLRGCCRFNPTIRIGARRKERRLMRRPAQETGISACGRRSGPSGRRWPSSAAGTTRCSTCWTSCLRRCGRGAWSHRGGALLTAIPYAPTRAEAEHRRELFARPYRRWYPKAVAGSSMTGNGWCVPWRPSRSSPALRTSRGTRYLPAPGLRLSEPGSELRRPALAPCDHRPRIVLGFGPSWRSFGSGG
jgi:hypothetical protein